MNRNLALEFIRVTEMAAISSARLMGRGNEKACEDSAIDSMRSMLDSIECNATILLGEGSTNDDNSLHRGEKVGTGNGPELEIALDALEGSTVCAQGGHNAISVIAISDKGGMFNAPDAYMDKIAVGPVGRGVIDIEESPAENLKRLAEAKKCRVQDLTAVVLDRERHQGLIEEIRATGARIQLIGDGDVAAAIACCNPKSGIDILFGIGGAKEGVISAAALQCLGGDLLAKFNWEYKDLRKNITTLSNEEFDKIWTIDDLASGSLMFCATGVTMGNFLKGVRFTPWGAVTHSIVMRSQSGTIRRIEAEHHFDTKPRY
jgi:fructose-1,6-bisphosphatase class II